MRLTDAQERAMHTLAEHGAVILGRGWIAHSTALALNRLGLVMIVAAPSTVRATKAALLTDAGRAWLAADTDKGE